MRRCIARGLPARSRRPGPSQLQTANVLPCGIPARTRTSVATGRPCILSSDCRLVCTSGLSLGTTGSDLKDFCVPLCYIGLPFNLAVSTSWHCCQRPTGYLAFGAGCWKSLLVMFRSHCSKPVRHSCRRLLLRLAGFNAMIQSFQFLLHLAQALGASRVASARL